jgi:ferrous iron transport protein B
MHTIALVGNPNSGKTTLFNALTGSNQHVGNWPGVTVEKKEGKVRYKDEEFNIVDLPGSYSLGAYSEDEVVARDFIVKGNPDIVINVLDATNIERNLYLTTQLLEMDTKVVLALNMMDEAKAKHIDIDLDGLSKKLGIPIVPTIALKEKGLDKLLETTHEYIHKSDYTGKDIDYGQDINEKIREISLILEDLELDYPPNWLALKVLEKDLDILSTLKEKNLPILDNKIEEIENTSSDYEFEIIDKRYEFIRNTLSGSMTKPETYDETFIDKVDHLLTHKWLGLPIFAIIMFIVFQLTFFIGEDLLGGLAASLVEGLGSLMVGALESINSPELFISFISEGLIGGVGAVVEFVPLIMTLYFFIGILEDIGYMARAAYVMDGIMRAVGLQGKTFISMIVGFGCNVPGIMATRTLDNKKDRMIALLINPFMSCGARIPIYLLFIGAFFPNSGGLVMFSIYFLGILVALIMAKIFSKTLFKGESSEFIMELPPYRIPALKYVLRDMWEKVWSFLKKAGTIIFAVVALLWVLSRLPFGVEPYSQESVLGMIGSFIAPIFIPAGFGTWQASVSLFAGIAAKESVVAVLGMVYAGVTEGSELVGAIQNAFTPLTALSFMVMVLLYTPCAAVIATVKSETNSYKWAIFMALYTFFLGWLGAVLVYQIGSLFV